MRPNLLSRIPPRLRLAGSGLIFFLMLAGLDRLLRFSHDGTGITPAASEIPAHFTLAWCVILTALVLCLPGLARKIAMGVVGGTANLLFLTHAVMHYAKGNFFSFSSLMYAADAAKFLDPEYFGVRKIIWVGLAAGVLALAAAILLAPEGRPSRWLCAGAAACIVLGIVSIQMTRDNNLTARTEAHYNIHQASLVYDEFSDADASLMLAGLYQYTFRDFCISFGVYDLFNRASNAETVKELEAWYAQKQPDPDNGWTGRYAGKNVILIQLEAIDTWMLNETFMPNLYAVQQRSVNFVNNYSPIYSDAGTFNSEALVNTGLIPPFTGARASMYSRNAYPFSLASLLAEEGYRTRSFHRSAGDVYNREVCHLNWGYEHYYDGAEMGVGVERLDFDEDLLAAYDLMVSDSPFLSFIITYSGHGAYLNSAVSAAYYDLAQSLLPEGTDEMMIHAMAHAWATDLFIGGLMERLEEDGRLEDTVLVFYSDHYNYYMLDDGLIMEQKGVYDENLIMQTPFFFYEKNTPPMTVEKTVSTVDILPTLVNLLGLPCDGRCYAGNDAFSENGGYVIFQDYSWYDATTYWRRGDEITQEIAARSEEIRTRLEMSWNTMKLDYFRAGSA